MKTQAIAYEPHPVSRERKAELRAAGYQILDARFKPAESEADPAPEADKPKRGRPAKADPAPEAE